MKTPCDEAAIHGTTATSPCRRAQQPWILTATIVASSMAFIDGTVVNVALPALEKSFGASVVDVQWVVDGYGLTLAALILTGGALGDLFGRRRVFLFGTAMFAGASALCGMAASISQLIAARLAQGMGAAFLVPGSLALISASFEESERGRAIGTWSGATAITTAVGPLMGGWLIDRFSWRWAFFINLPLALAVIAISLWQVPESRGRRDGAIDWFGTAAATAGLSGLVFGFIEATRFGWKNPLVLSILFGGLVASLGFVVVEARSAKPMVPLSLFRSRAFTGANLLTFFLYAAIGIFFFVFPLNLIQVQGYTATAAGAAVVPAILLMFLLSRWSGGLVYRYGARLPLMIGPLIVALGFFLFSLPSVGGNYWRTFFPAVAVLGAGMAVSVAPLTTVVMGEVEPEHVGTASGINNAVARLAGVLAIAVLGMVMVMLFSGELNRRLSDRRIPAEVRDQLQRNEVRMAALRAPAGVDPETASAIESAILDSFVFSFRRMMWICAILASISMAIAWRMIPGASRANTTQEASRFGGKPKRL